MKKLLMYLVVAIVVVTCGFSIYYVVRNNEEISAIELTDMVYYMNEGETLPIPLEYTNPSPHTEFTYSIEQGYEDYVTVDLDAWTITANRAGLVNITFTSTNENYARYEIPCSIGNGSSTTPWYIRNVEDLQNIGKGKHLYSDNYQLTNDIVVGGEMLPIGVVENNGIINTYEFTGTLSGGNNRYAIKDVVIDRQDKNFFVGGVFAIIGSTGKVENVKFENISVNGSFNYAGVVAGVNYGLIGMCEVSDSEVVNTKSDFAYTGGICGLNKRSEGSSNFAQVNICSSDVAITSKYVAGGAVGFNDAGVIFNCQIRTRSLDLQVVEGADSTYSYFGGVAGISRSYEYENEVYTSYVSNCLVYIDSVDNTTSHIAGVFGAYYGIPNLAGSGGNYSMIFYISESGVRPYYIHGDDVVISDGNPNSASHYVKQISHEEALQRTTYTSIPGNRWDFDEVWQIETGASISLRFTANEDGDMPYQFFPASGNVYEINSDNIEEAFDNMRGNPSQNMVYEVTETVVLNLNGETWQPIGTSTNPFMGQIVMGEDVYIILRNVTIASSTYTGLFGYVSGNNTLIQNIYIDNLTIEGGTMVGGIAGYNDGATIQNCLINGFDITSSKYAGVFAGFNTGRIINCKYNVSYEIAYQTDDFGEPTSEQLTLYGTTVSNSGTTNYVELINPVMIIDDEGNFLLAIEAGRVYNTLYTYDEEFDVYSELDSSLVLATDNSGEPIPYSYGEGRTNISDQHSSIMYIGGFVGKNQGSISSGIGRGSNYINLAVKDSTSAIYVGGVVGLNNGSVRDINISYLTVEASTFDGLIYAGGIVGYQYDSGSLVEACVIDQTNNIIISKSNQNSIAGGIAGFVGRDSTVRYSSTDVISITACSAGGFAGIVNGNVEECYSTQNTTLNASYAGGFACTLNGSIKNSMSAATVNGDVVQAGMTVYLRSGSSIDYCYIDVAFNNTSGGSTYAETSSAFRANSGTFGTITNSIIVGDTGSSVVEFGFPIYLQYGIVNGKLAPYLTINGAAAEMQAYYIWWWQGFEGSDEDAMVASTSAVSGQGAALSGAGFDETIWDFSSSDPNQYVLPTNAAGNAAEARSSGGSTGGTTTPSGPSGGDDGEITDPDENPGDVADPGEGDVTDPGEGDITDPGEGDVTDPGEDTGDDTTPTDPEQPGDEEGSGEGGQTEPSQPEETEPTEDQQDLAEAA